MSSAALIEQLEKMTVLEINELVKELEERWASPLPRRSRLVVRLPPAAVGLMPLRPRSRPSSTSS